MGALSGSAGGIGGAIGHGESQGALWDMLTGGSIGGTKGILGMKGLSSSDQLKAYLDPFEGMNEKEIAALKKKATGKTLMATGLGILADGGYSAMPRAGYESIANAGLQAMTLHPKHLGNESLAMRRQGLIGGPSEASGPATPAVTQTPESGLPPYGSHNAPGQMAAVSDNMLDALYPNQKPFWIR